MEASTTSEQLKQIVKEKYSEVADQSHEQNAASCCGATCCSPADTAVMAEDYKHLKGYVSEADLGLGCGLPTEFAKISEGDVVIDLGSGAGNDAFVARSIVGSSGKVIGVDFTEKMIARARENAEKLNYHNVEFRLGDIENLPVSNGTANVIVSNCVLNLVPDKAQAFREIYRVLKTGGHFSVSDIVLKGALPYDLKQSAEMYAGCVSGAIQKAQYLSLIESAGFDKIVVQKERRITIPDEILSVYLNNAELEKYQSGEAGIYSITVYAEKNETSQTKKETPCCGPECCGK
jgi:arsenite methyltransferase